MRADLAREEQTVHVLLLNWNGWRDTIECLESVLRLEWPELRVIVCDNGSTDGSEARIAEWARGALDAPVSTHPALAALVTPPVRKPIPMVRYDRAAAERGGDPAADARLVLIQNGANLGFAAGNNVALRYLLARGARGYVWVLNNDTVVAPDALAALVAAARDDASIGAVGSTYLDYREPQQVVERAGGRLSRWTGWTRPAVDAEAAERLDFVKGASVLVPMEVLARVGPMDERYFLYSEDVDWSIAMRARGFRLAYAAASRVWHKEGAASGHRSPVHDRHSVKSALTLVAKHDPLRLPAAALYSAVRCAAPKVVRGEWARLGAVAHAWRDFARDSLGERRTSLGSPLRGRLLVRNPVWNAWLRASEAALAVVRDRPAPSPPPVPRRLLVVVGGHLGDAVIATSVLPLLARAFPRAELGVLVGSWARVAVEGHPAVAHVHVADHWKLARGDETLAEKIAAWQRTSARAVDELRETGYDTAVDLSAYYPNMAAVLERAEIPVRIGWTSGGHAPRYTHSLAWTGGARHTAEQHADLLRAHWPEAIGRAEAAAPLAYALPTRDATVDARVHARFRSLRVEPGEYVVVHVGAGDPRKGWPSDRWRAAVRTLAAEGERLVLTGSGARDDALVREVADGVAGATSLVDRLSWSELRAVVAAARAVLSVDTVVAHLAAAEGVPCVVVRAAMSDERHWRPLGRAVTVVTSPVSGAPCFRSRGCASMACIRDVTADMVLDAARATLAQGRESRG